MVMYLCKEIQLYFENNPFNIINVYVVNIVMKLLSYLLTELYYYMFCK